ncbi:rhamnogalacturonan acetylesterase [Aquibacillus rhizosphaerae]|uniref:Rhamnogalacturonan acetylesterase n=1 Tax=Aquibacillus rhizosphaerae TaxID=3051431 RepID=A0ABT7L8X2_9BACI|nr:rhamnogalacturonan acetylesterase [Aquibacillus sp. LR5S19]MDL4842303.1 rhamnogalacturonan acetylesterase [Aquibacillus sp. LR5S19]
MNDTIKFYLASDSTVQTYQKSEAPQAGWGQFIANYLDDTIEVCNHAIGGRSTKTFISEGHLQKILDEIGEGDYLFVQMGHNDSTKIRPERYTDPYDDYKKYLKQYIEGARKNRAIPILITPVGRLHYVNGEFLRDFGDYCNAMKEVAEEESVLLIDLMKSSIDYYSSIGYKQASNLFMISINGEDCTHFTEQGANEIAKLVSIEIKNLQIGVSKLVK